MPGNIILIGGKLSYQNGISSLLEEVLNDYHIEKITLILPPADSQQEAKKNMKGLLKK